MPGDLQMAFISGRTENGQLDFDALIESIGRLYPGTAVTVPDYYAARIEATRAVPWSKGVGYPSPATECLERVAREHGLQRQIAVAVRENVTLSGRVDRLGCAFIGKGFSEADVAPLVKLLWSSGLTVEVEGYE
jgi:hypothetical protein